MTKVIRTPKPKRYLTSEAGRGYVVDFFEGHLKKHDYSRYIRTSLAADFACTLSEALTDLREEMKVAEQMIDAYMSVGEALGLEDVTQFNVLNAVNALKAAPSNRVNLAAKALIDDIKARYSGEELYCDHMIELEAALNAVSNSDEDKPPRTLKEAHERYTAVVDEIEKITNRIRSAAHSAPLEVVYDQDPITVALKRCQDCWEDGEGVDIGINKLKALEAFGYVQKSGRQWEFTQLGNEKLKASSNT